MSYARFFVNDALVESRSGASALLGESRSGASALLGENFREKFLEAIALRAMRPLDAEEDIEERSGWCALGDPYQLELNHERVFYNNYLNLGFRTDRWAIPAPILRTKLNEAETAYLASKGRERLAKREREELKQLVVRKLRKQFVPTVRMVDLSWSIEEGLVRFFSHSARTTAAMADLFAQTFGVELTIEAPYTLAARLGLSPEQERAWEELEPFRPKASTDLPRLPALGEN